MRKSVKNGPLPDTDAPAQGGDEVDALALTADGRDRADGQTGAIAAAKSLATGRVPATGSDDEANLNDAWLVERARHADHAAFAILVQRYERKLVRVLARLVRDPELARDLAQETFWACTAVWIALTPQGGLVPGCSVSVSTLAWTSFAAFEPSPSRLHPLIGPPAMVGCHLSFPIPIPESRPSWPRKSSLFWRKCRSSYRTILVLRDLEGFSSSEVAAIVGRQEATIRWRLSKARDKFREIWQRRQEGARQEATDG